MNYKELLKQRQVQNKLKHACMQLATPNYFETAQMGHFKPRSRQALIAWFQSVALKKDINSYVIFRATTLLDMFLSTATSLFNHPLFTVKSVDAYTFAAAIAFDVAGKVDTSSGISKSSIKTFKISPVLFLKAEEYFLETLNYDVSFPDQMDVTELILEQVGWRAGQSSRPETPFDENVLSETALNDDARLLECSVRMLRIVLEDTKFIGVSVLQQSLMALLAAARARNERIVRKLRDISVLYGVDFDTVQIGAKAVMETWQCVHSLDD